MKPLITLLLMVWLVHATAGHDYDQECFANFSETFPTDPEILADRIQVEIVHYFYKTNMFGYQLEVRRRQVEVLERGLETIFQFSHPDAAYDPRNLTLYYDGSSVFGSMAAYLEQETEDGEDSEFHWECLNSSDSNMVLKFFDVSFRKFDLIF